mmetsp:Transcript_59331/g.157959  ORF Transcript_59331/g.157959 Transcript_59331/m.157959 type:complete len:284 (-) Transcript_59331:56-907(-)
MRVLRRPHLVFCPGMQDARLSSTHFGHLLHCPLYVWCCIQGHLGTHGRHEEREEIAHIGNHQHLLQELCRWCDAHVVHGIGRRGRHEKHACDTIGQCIRHRGGMDAAGRDCQDREGIHPLFLKDSVHIRGPIKQAPTEANWHRFREAKSGHGDANDPKTTRGSQLAHPWSCKGLSGGRIACGPVHGMALRIATRCVLQKSAILQASPLAPIRLDGGLADRESGPPRVNHHRDQPTDCKYEQHSAATTEEGTQRQAGLDRFLWRDLSTLLLGRLASALPHLGHG